MLFRDLARRASTLEGRILSTWDRSTVPWKAWGVTLPRSAVPVELLWSPPVERLWSATWNAIAAGVLRFAVTFVVCDNNRS